MKWASEISQKHEQIDKMLNTVANEVFERSDKSPTAICDQIAVIFDISGCTVYNLVLGKCKSDGFLKEAVLDEFKKLL